MAESKEKLIIFTKPGCGKCEIAKKLGEKLKDKYAVKYLSIDTVDGLSEFTYLGIQYPPAVVLGDIIYTSITKAEKELL